MLRIAALLASFLSLSVAAGAEIEVIEELEDAGALGEYAYYAEDRAALERILEEVQRIDTTLYAELSAYHRGLAAYRLARLGGDGAAAYAGRCIDDLGAALEKRQAFAEALALQSACYALRAELEPIRAVLYRPLADRRMERARELSPSGPRVLLLDAIRSFPRKEPQGADIARFEAARDELAAEHSAPRGWPRWGEAEAWLYIGEIELARQNVIPARNALEQALLIAPDYVRARILLGRIANLRQ